MKKTLLAALIIALFIILYPRKEYVTACFNTACFRCETAKTYEERAIGLMNREKLPSSEGMLFYYENPSIISIWMKNTLIPLDIIWLDENLDVVYINSGTLPCTSDPCPVYKNSLPASYVLEINSGFAEKNNITIGSRMTLLSSKIL